MSVPAVASNAFAQPCLRPPRRVAGAGLLLAGALLLASTALVPAARAELRPDGTAVVQPLAAGEGAVAFRVPGTVAGRHVSVGDQVGKGQLLLELDSVAYYQSVRAAEDALAAAAADCDRAARAVRLTAALLRDGRADADTLEARRAEAALARQRLRDAHAALDQARALMDRTMLTAETDGTVTAVLVGVGDRVRDGVPVLRLKPTLTQTAERTER
ncbi:biotin/lipoyl-binding protein [Rhodocista pekingensis]|uniref:Biotin/lipoyl-binding protein n=1 Tax=Rhodocista pekingensis TaxID=201185 RepID=A0ABW2KV41_9PROT